jgi:hypothetical protein
MDVRRSVKAKALASDAFCLLSIAFLYRVIQQAGGVSYKPIGYVIAGTVWQIAQLVSAGIAAVTVFAFRNKNSLIPSIAVCVLILVSGFPRFGVLLAQIAYFPRNTSLNLSVISGIIIAVFEIITVALFIIGTAKKRIMWVVGICVIVTGILAAADYSYFESVSIEYSFFALIVSHEAVTILSTYAGFALFAFSTAIKHADTVVQMGIR